MLSRILTDDRKTMRFLPTESITYRTKLKEDEIIKRLSDLIEPEKIFRFELFGSSSTKSYVGQISGRTFDIRRRINYRNSFLPRISGVIQRDFDGTTIRVRMRLHIFVVIFLCIWCGGVGSACLAFVTQALASSEFNPVTLIPVGMLLFVYALTMGAFKFESSKSKRDLHAIFEADTILE